jgi:Tfp pilus assembly protein PilP
MKTKTNERCNELFKMGMIFSFKENSYIGKTDDISDFNVSTVEILCDSDEEWNSRIEKLKSEINHRHSK